MITVMDMDMNSLAAAMTMPQTAMITLQAMTTLPAMTMMTKTKLHLPASNPTAMTSQPHHPHMSRPHTARPVLL